MRVFSQAGHTKHRRERNTRTVPGLGSNEQGAVVQSIISLTSSLRGQPVKCFTTLEPNTLTFFVEKLREAFALQKLLTFFQQEILANFRY